MEGCGERGPVQILSRHIIKPSSPTPDHLKTLKLSLIDQLALPVYVPLIFFYNQNPLAGHAHLCPALMHSLSKVLSLFYPLAGKLDLNNFAIDCDDSSVEFVEARVHSRLHDELQNLKMDQLGRLLPVDLAGGIYVGQGTVFMVQVNSFECGGVAVAACISHHAADAHSFVDFMNAWAAISRGDLSNCNRVAYHFMGNGKSMAAKIFCFDKEKLSSLKETAKSSLVNKPTRVESVSAFIWKHFMDKKSNEESGAAKKTLGFVHAINIRSRADPSLQLQRAFGNAIVTASAFATKGRWQMSELTARLRTAIRNVDAEYIKEIEDRYMRELEELKEKATIKGGADQLHTCSSWSRFPVYDVDFGWGSGSPARVCTAAMPFLKNATVLMSSKNGGEIEAWMNYPAEDLEMFEKEFNLIGTVN